MQDLAKKIDFTFNNFDGKNHQILDAFYSPSVIFEDPVTKLSSLSDLKRYYQHAYKNVKKIQFSFKSIEINHLSATATWVMHAEIQGLNGGKPYSVSGVSLLNFDTSGLVIAHRDYVDLGAMIYEQLPVIGIAIKKLKQFLGNY